ncbi:hypothetical protein PCARR_b0684 [Pseudoalteromonas carrageenovora IAM 12662]|uniref:Uncharacterized protein n=1 Tax=Pseudoalteromonas carrageenovora IAM 12662 TaxID=1314868 RepID=A0ABR9EVU3_PSEVC|nr:hypothetical protein [Pseudoalteromonas carrageenovora IAM 12662]
MCSDWLSSRSGEIIKRVFNQCNKNFNKNKIILLSINISGLS